MWAYLFRYQYSDVSIKSVETILKLLPKYVNQIYEALLEFSWYVYYLAIYKGKKHELIYVLQDNLKIWWNEYFSDSEAYESWIRNEGLNDWRGIKSVDDCFFYSEISDVYKNSLSVLDFMGKVENKVIVTRDEKLHMLLVAMPINALGEKILDATLRRMNNLETLPEDKDGMINIFYQEKESVFKELKEKEMGYWHNKDIKIPREKCEVTQIYALVHMIIVKSLNR